MKLLLPSFAAERRSLVIGLFGILLCAPSLFAQPKVARNHAIQNSQYSGSGDAHHVLTQSIRPAHLPATPVVTNSNYTLSPYICSLPLSAGVSGMAIDPATRTLFVADQR